MGLIDRLIDATRSLFNLGLEIQKLREEMIELRKDVDDLRRDLQTLSERVTRLEAQRTADRAEWEARFTQFTAEVSKRSPSLKPDCFAQGLGRNPGARRSSSLWHRA